MWIGIKNQKWIRPSTFKIPWVAHDPKSDSIKQLVTSRVNHKTYHGVVVMNRTTGLWSRSYPKNNMLYIIEEEAISGRVKLI